MSPIPPSLITPTVPTEVQTAVAFPVPTNPAITAPSTTPGTTPSTPVNAPREIAITTPLLKTTTDTSPKTAPPPTMGHKSRKGVLYTTAILLPPLAIYFQHGTHRKHFALSVVLTLFGWIPGVLHALYHVSK